MMNCSLYDNDADGDYSGAAEQQHASETSVGPQPLLVVAQIRSVLGDNVVPRILNLRAGSRC